MRALLDVNVLIALFDAAHQHHERAHQWFEENMAHGWASCPLTENGVVRILSNPRYSPEFHRPVAEIVEDLQTAIAQTNHHFWPDDLSLCDRTLFSAGRIQGHRQITDTYLLALAVSRGGRLVTLDAGIRSETVVGAGKEHLFWL